MKVHYLYTLITCIIGISACETIVDVKVNEEDSYLAVDAWLTHKSGDQVIRLTRTQPYYDNSFSTGVTGATVSVTSGSGQPFNFTDQGDGNYLYSSVDTFGVVGESYNLEIDWDGHTYTASTFMPRVPQIDSVRFSYEDGFGDAYYYSEFFAIDPEGEDDAYWIKAWKNGKYLNKPSEIYLNYDVSGSKGNGDGEPFIFPIRILANPFDQDINLNLIKPFWLGDTIQANNSGEFSIYDSKTTIENNELVVINEGKKFEGGVERYPLDGAPFFQIDENTIGKEPDSIYLELHAISYDAWFFLTRLQQETNRPGGFGALFATPPANLPTNITCDDEDVPVVGIFNVSNFSSAGEKIRPEVILPEN